MQKDFGAQAHALPNAMNTACGSISISNCVIFSTKLRKNLAQKAFAVSMATAQRLTACGYVGIDSGSRDLDKFAKAGFHVTKSEFVDTLLIDELPMAVECKLISYQPEPWPWRVR